MQSFDRYPFDRRSPHAEIKDAVAIVTGGDGFYIHGGLRLGFKRISEIMDKTDNATPPLNEVLSTWTKSASEYWENTFRIWSEIGQNLQFQNGPFEHGGAGRVQTTLASAIKNMQALSAAFFEPEAMEAVFKGTGAMPDMLQKMSQSFVNGFMQVQQKAFERAGRIGKTAEAFKFEDLDENAFRAWTEIYEKEFSRFLNVPQLGLMRFHQEKINRMLDKYAIFQSTFAEFSRLLSLPMTRSMTVMQDKLSDLAETGELPEDSNAYYQMWIKILEGHYMTLFQSSEYVQTLEKTLRTLSEFSRAKNDVMEDMLSGFPIPTQSEMDALYQEIHLLKKRIRALEKNRNK